MGKLAIKRLTDSDLTLFDWHFHNHNTGNQKSINLNANVFISQLYPSLPNTDVGRAGRIPLDMFIYGPGHARAWNLQRKIIKGNSYKNWRLNGEVILNPAGQPERFNALQSNDYVIFDFEGDLFPTAARVVFVARSLPEDAALHAGLTDAGIPSMIGIELPQLRLIVHASGTPESHPISELLLDAAIEDAAQGGIEGTQRLRGRNTGRRMTRAELERARQRADDVGRMGEELINGYFASLKQAGSIHSAEWASNDNVIEPFDFLLRPAEHTSIKAEVKSTLWDFNQVLHISIAQLHEASESERYDLYRVYSLDEQKGVLRVAENIKSFAQSVLEKLRELPHGVTTDSVSIRPDTLNFGPEISIDLTAENDDDESLF